MICFIWPIGLSINKKSKSPCFQSNKEEYVFSLIDLCHNWQERRNPILFSQGLGFLYDAAYVHVRMGRSMGATPVASSFIPPSATRTNCTPALPAYTRRDRPHKAGTFTEERKRRKALVRLVYFGRPLRSGFSFDVPDLTIENLLRFARQESLLFLSSFCVRSRVHSTKILSLPDFVKSAGITTLVRMGVTLSRGSRLARCQEIVHRGDVDTRTLPSRSRRILFYRTS